MNTMSSKRAPIKSACERYGGKIAAARVEQKELLNWFQGKRGEDTLSPEDAVLLYGNFIDAGYCTIDGLKTIDWSVLENMKLGDLLMRWLSVWLPKNYTDEEYGDLSGRWEDSAGMRHCFLLPHKNGDGYLIREQYEDSADERAFMHYCPQSPNPSRVTLNAPWGYNGGMRSWEGNVNQNGTRITWTTGRRGISYWHKITE